MSQFYSSLEIFRWGYAHLPGAVFFYAKELELDIEDIGVLSSIFYAFEQAKPLFESGVRAGQVLQCCSCLTTNKLSRRLNRLQSMGLLVLVEGSSKLFADRIIYLDPLMEKLDQLIMRDHPNFVGQVRSSAAQEEEIEQQMKEYQETIEQLQLQLDEQKERQNIESNPLTLSNPPSSVSSEQFRRVADFISKKTGNLLSVKMEKELHTWLDDLGFTPEFLLCMLELTFERNINNPREITRIARDLKEYSINTVEGLESYFTNYVETDKSLNARNFFDPDVIEFGNFTGIDMNAEARKNIYYKWRYDWGFTHPMIMKAGEIMCQRTKNGGLEYIDSVLNNWMSKEIRSLEEVEKELQDFKARKKANKGHKSTAMNTTQKSHDEYEIYVPPEVIEELKSKV